MRHSGDKKASKTNDPDGERPTPKKRGRKPKEKLDGNEESSPKKSSVSSAGHRSDDSGWI